MKLLLVHTYYAIRGGEETTFEQEVSLLGKTQQVKILTFKNHTGISGAFQFFFSIWNFVSASKMRKAVQVFNPDIIHIHNLHFAAGPAIIRIAKKLNKPVVITIQNYRLLCPSATLLKNDKIFTKSIKQFFPWYAVINKVYRNSYIQTFWLAFIIWFHKEIGTWDQADRYLVQTEFARSIFYDSKFLADKSKLIIKPNFTFQTQPGNSSRQNHFLYLGRFSNEKGISSLLSVFKNSNFNLKLGGSGPLQNNIEKASLEFTNIQYLGILNHEQVILQLKLCTALILPSVWFEGMPLIILEAFSCGTPVIASNIGAMKFMITNNFNGLFFEPGDEKDLREKIVLWMSFNEQAKLNFSQNALKTYRDNYTPEKNYSQLMSIYNSIINEKN